MHTAQPPSVPGKEPEEGGPRVLRQHPGAGWVMHGTRVTSWVITVQGLYPHGHLLGQHWSCAQAGKLRLNEVKMLP